MFYDEENILDIRLNYLSKFVDKFIIVESKYAHNGDKRKLLFNKNKFLKYSNKIIYIVLDKKPSDLEIYKEKKIKNNDLIILSGFGVGLSWGSCIIKWKNLK